MAIRLPGNAPSLQHLARSLDFGSAERTAKNIIEVRDSALSISTYEARRYVGLVLSGDFDIDWIRSQASGIKNTHLRQAALEIIPLAEELRAEYGIDWFQPYERMFLQFTPTVRIPISPLGVAAIAEKLHVVWPQVWKRTTLTADQFNFVCSVIYRKVILADPQLSNLLWAEMSAVDGDERVLQVRTLEASRLFSEKELSEIAAILDAAMKIVEATPRTKRPQTTKIDPNQLGFSFAQPENDDV